MYGRSYNNYKGLGEWNWWLPFHFILLCIPVVNILYLILMIITGLIVRELNK